MTLHSFAPLCSQGLWCRAGCYTAVPVQRTGTWRPLSDDHRVARSAAIGIKLSSGGTLATIFSRKYDIHRITPMTKLAILEYPDPRLRTKATPVAVFDEALHRL